MPDTRSKSADLMDERLAMLWYQVDRLGDYDLREEIEEVSDRFMYPGDTPIGTRDIKGAHEVFQRAHEKYTASVQARFGLRLVQCPHCEGKEAPNE